MLPLDLFKLLFLFLFIKCSTLQHTNPSVSHWDYQRRGPDTWKYTFESCEGDSQSPIDIRTSHVRYDPNLKPLSINGYRTNTSSSFWNFTHDGHSIVVYPRPLAHLSISGANLPSEFFLVQYNFHWGYNVYQGSEHTIDGVKYPLEIHFVHQALSSESFAILSILFHLQRDDNPYINDLLPILNQTIDSSVSIEHHLDISRLFPVSLTPRFYLYHGSLTTPPCTEGVTWIILARPVPISSSQLEVFASNSIPSNFRSPQRLYGRKIIANFRPEPHASSQDEEDENIHHSSASISQVFTYFFPFIVYCYFREFI